VSSSNDFSLDPSTVAQLIALAVDESHTAAMRSHALAALKHQRQSATFGANLVESPHSPHILNIQSSSAEKADVSVQLSLLLRNLIDHGLDLMVENKVHLLLFSAIDCFCDSLDFVFNCLRILAKICERETVSTNLLAKYTANGLVNTFLFLIDKRTNNLQILSRLCYVLAGFFACELSSARKMTSALIELLSIPDIRSDRFVAAMIIQVIANLSVDSECSALSQQSDSIPKLPIGCTFDADDRLGFNLLCAASNFTFHNRSRSPPELIEAVPVAIVSRHIPSIIEAFRVLCNLATFTTPVLVRNRVPEMLRILAKHIRAEVMLLAL
jgi:hypothetical protein